MSGLLPWDVSVPLWNAVEQGLYVIFFGDVPLFDFSISSWGLKLYEVTCELVGFRVEEMVTLRFDGSVGP